MRDDLFEPRLTIRISDGISIQVDRWFLPTKSQSTMASVVMGELSWDSPRALHDFNKCLMTVLGVTCPQHFVSGLMSSRVSVPRAKPSLTMD